MRYPLLGALAVVFSAVAPRAYAQTYEAIGARAQGMGAFVAVADDATATWWNPAGLATGKLFSLTVDRAVMEDPALPAMSGPARRETSKGMSVAFPALALSYYRSRISEIAPGSDVDLRALAVSQYGLTMGQSLGQHLVIGTTLKLLKAGETFSSGAANAPGALLDATDELAVVRETTTDIDVGAMVAVGVTRLGVSVRNAREPEFGQGATRFVMGRQARAGAAFVGSMSGAVEAVTMAVDLDLTRTPTVAGDVRRFATGAEIWFARRHVGVRSGFSVNTVGDRNPTGHAGVSLGGVSGLFLDAAILFGSDQARNGLNIGLSLTF